MGRDIREDVDHQVGADQRDGIKALDEGAGVRILVTGAGGLIGIEELAPGESRHASQVKR